MASLGWSASTTTGVSKTGEARRSAVKGPPSKLRYNRNAFRLPVVYLKQTHADR